jgi:glutamate/tyrosine decarboxylase-like PLP-dependent enzyme
LYKHDSPYTYFTTAELHLGEISLECSRPGAAAAALWATQRLLPLQRAGEFARGLERGREAALKFHQAVQSRGEFIPAFAPELDILVFVPRGNSLSEISGASRRIFAAAARENLHLAVAELPLKFWNHLRAENGRETVTCLRSVLMKPEHLDWIDRIVKILDQSSSLA